MCPRGGPHGQYHPTYLRSEAPSSSGAGRPRHQQCVGFLGSLAAGIAHDNANTFNALLLKLELLRQKEIIHACDLQPIERQPSVLRN